MRGTFLGMRSIAMCMACLLQGVFALPPAHGQYGRYLIEVLRFYLFKM